MYNFLHPILLLFNNPKERSFVPSYMKAVQRFKFLSYFFRLLHKTDTTGLDRELFGLHFPNPVGAAAGLDKDGDIYNALCDCGFSWVEIGSVTPKPQTTDEPLPRLDLYSHSIRHSMHSSSKGAMNVIGKLQKTPHKGIIAVNLAPNLSSTKDEDLIHDYSTSFSLFYDFVDMFVINVSTTNINGADPIQEIGEFSEILNPILEMRLCYEEYKPILIKISPDTPHEHLDVILDFCRLSGVDGVVAGNASKEMGGLSGAKIYDKALSLVKYIVDRTGGRFPVIACGGIMTPKQAEEMLEAGASLVQLCSAMILEGPSTVRNTIKYLAKCQRKKNLSANSSEVQA